MKQIITVLMLITLMCGNAFAGLSSEDLESFLEDLLEIFGFNTDDTDDTDDDEESLLVDPPETETLSLDQEWADLSNNLDISADQDLLVVPNLSEDNCSQDFFEGEYSNQDLKTIPEPGAMILGALGLSIAGYLKRRRTL